MAECELCKTKDRSIDEKRRLQNRINRIIGQMNGIKRMIDENRYCDDILIQLSAINNSIKSLANNILEEHLNSCVVDKIKSNDLGIISEVMEIVKRFQ